MAKNNILAKDNQKFKKFNSNKNRNYNDKGHNKNTTKNFKNNKNNNKMKGVKNDTKCKDDNKKINYVLHPRLLKKKLNAAKESEKSEKEKLLQLKKRKRNAIFMRKTDKGQPKLNGRMKILYDQIARSCEKT